MLQNIYVYIKQKFIIQTIAVFISIALLLLVSGIARANDVLQDFTFTTINGKIFDDTTLNDSPMVINIMAHW